MTDDEHIPDEFELALRKWVALDGIVASAREGAALCDVDPALAEAVEDACREEDLESIIELLTDLLRAMGELKRRLETN